MGKKNKIKKRKKSEERESKAERILKKVKEK